MGLFDGLFGRKKKPAETVQVQAEPQVKVEEKEEKPVRVSKKERQEIAMAHFSSAEKEKETAVALTQLSVVNGQLVDKITHLEDEVRRLHKEQLEKHHYTQQLVNETKGSVDSIKLDYAKGRQVDDINRQMAEVLNAVKKYVPPRDVELKAKISSTEEQLDRLVQLDPMEKIILDLLSSNPNRSFDTDELMTACHLDKAITNNRVKLSRIMNDLVVDGAVIREEKNKRNILFRISPRYKK